MKQSLHVAAVATFRAEREITKRTKTHWKEGAIDNLVMEKDSRRGKISKVARKLVVHEVGMFHTIYSEIMSHFFYKICGFDI